MPIPGCPLQAGGNIRPCRLLKIGAADNLVIEATAATDVIIGVSAPWTRQAPYGSLDDGFHAIAGEPVEIYGQGEIAPVIAGSGGMARGGRITSDGNGQGVAASAGNGSVGVALQTVAAGTKGEVLISIHTA